MTRWAFTVLCCISVALSAGNYKVFGQSSQYGGAGTKNYSIDDVISEGIEKHQSQTYFAALFKTMTDEIQLANKRGHFTDSVLIEYIHQNFTTYYFNALSAYQNGDSLSYPWRVALDTAICSGCGYVQWLMLGSNVHINHDLFYILANYFKVNGTNNHPSKITQREFLKISAQETDRLVEVFLKNMPHLNRLERTIIRSWKGYIKRQIKKYLRTTWRNAMAAAGRPEEWEKAEQRQEKFARKKADSFIHPGFVLRWGIKRAAPINKLPFEKKVEMLLVK